MEERERGISPIAVKKRVVPQVGGSVAVAIRYARRVVLAVVAVAQQGPSCNAKQTHE